MKALQEYKQDVQDEIVEATDEAAKKLVKLLKKTSPKKRGAYAKDWSHKKENDKNGIYRRAVYNKKHYQLTHLLEHGHDPGENQKTKVKAIPHIEPAYEQIEKEFEQAVIKAIEKYK